MRKIQNLAAHTSSTSRPSPTMTTVATMKTAIERARMDDLLAMARGNDDAWAVGLILAVIDGSATEAQRLAVADLMDALDDIESPAVPVCAACLCGCHAGGEPDFAFRAARDGEPCGAADHDG